MKREAVYLTEALSLSAGERAVGKNTGGPGGVPGRLLRGHINTASSLEDAGPPRLWQRCTVGEGLFTGVQLTGVCSGCTVDGGLFWVYS